MFLEEDDFDFLDGDGRYMDDDGTELYPDLIPKPGLCLFCSRDEMNSEIVLCNLNRLDQRDEREFKCFSYRPKRPPSHDDWDPELFNSK